MNEYQKEKFSDLEDEIHDFIKIDYGKSMPILLFKKSLLRAIEDYYEATDGLL